jgi:hypothetical protein
MTATPALTTDLKAQVKLLADDLRKRLEENSELLVEWKRIHLEAQAKDRTAMSWVDWREDRIDQAAVAWVLTTVFIRFCEDNSLVKPVWISGPVHRRQEALDAQLAYFRKTPEHTDREWLVSAIDYLGTLPATSALVDTHSALEYVSPSGDAVTKIVEFWRRRGDDGALIHDLSDGSLSTRFLGDLYQDLSGYAKDKYALLQTPVFVEEFILDRTLEPALAERPLEGFRMIDPTCGSGHFLLGAFARILDRWHKRAPGVELQARVQTALDAIHGVDLNPIAIAIARFRLMTAALRACELRSLEDAPAFKFHLAVGDSLIHGPDENVIPGLEARSSFMPFHYATEDGSVLMDLLHEGRYDAVVGNPPYITVDDGAVNRIYRSKFGKICKGSYALSVPFMVEFFALAKKGEDSGWVGMITSNSFMKRRFGAPLIEEFLPKIDLKIVIDSEGAWIAGHNTDGTPTVILVGRRQPPASRQVRCVLSKGKRETRVHGNEGQGPYWSALTGHLDEPGWDSEWITIADLDRSLLSRHPWSLSGGGAVELKALIDGTSAKTLGAIAADVGLGAVTREDDAYMLGSAALARWRVSDRHQRPLVEGRSIREWGVNDAMESLWPYNPLTLAAECDPYAYRLLWPCRTILADRTAYGQTQVERGLQWFEYSMFFRARYKKDFSIAVPTVSTSVHAALIHGNLVFKDTAIVIILREDPTSQWPFFLLGALNSSVACFWIKENSQPKGGAAGISWLRTYQVNGATLQKLPLPSSHSSDRARILDSLAQELTSYEPRASFATGAPSALTLGAARVKESETFTRMVSLQEESDWEFYRLYGVIDDDMTYSGDDLPEIIPGERAFEIALAQNGQQSIWFERNGSMPVTDIPHNWPTGYRELVKRRISLIASNPYIKLLEKPEYKRRWQRVSWEKRQEQALRNWLLDRLEDPKLWFDSQRRPSPRSMAQLADIVNRDAEMVSMLALWEGRPDVPVTDSLKRLLEDEAVPFHSGYRYKESGLGKRKAWEEIWTLQRREDAGEKIQIDVPPKYTAADFTKASYWKHRGKLDVPKERFILYPDASRDGDGTPLLGWAGWDHAEQALALASIIHDREQEGWSDERLVPLVAGLAELQPWVDQWHGDVHPVYNVPLAAFCAEELARRAAQVSMTIEQLRWWRPEKKGKGRGKG